MAHDDISFRSARAKRSPERSRRVRMTRLDADLAEAGKEALDFGVVPPVDDDRFEFGEQAQTRYVLLDRSAMRRGFMKLGMERIDRRVSGVCLGKRRVQILMRQRLAQA